MIFSKLLKIPFPFRCHWFLAVVLAFTISIKPSVLPAQEVAIALSTQLTFVGEDGQEKFEVELGEQLQIRGPSGAGFTFEKDGTIGILLNENIGVQIGPAGCFAISLSEAKESEVIDLEIRGQEDGAYQGPSLSVTGTFGVELGAEVEFCLEVRPGQLLSPSKPGTQRMALAGFVEPTELGWSLRTTLSAGISAGVEFSHTLEAYCADEPLEPPSNEVTFEVLDSVIQDIPSLLTDLEQDYGRIGKCVWAAQAQSPDFARAFINSLKFDLEGAASTDDFVSELSLISLDIRAVDCYATTDADPDERVCETAIAAAWGTHKIPNEERVLSVMSDWIFANQVESASKCSVRICDEGCLDQLPRMEPEEIAQLIRAMAVPGPSIASDP